MWETETNLILMLTRCMEGHVDKCAQYWPDEVDFIEDHGNFEVLLGSENVEEFCTRRTIHITDVKKGERRIGTFSKIIHRSNQIAFQDFLPVIRFLIISFIRSVLLIQRGWSKIKK